ncbi:tandem-95 repeat protein [Pseudomonas tolaasii]|uniref:tandem-95 repeat protein n=1 Tax=Pseudomonas TaxID=286 RepID=UPI0015A3B5D6|nr:MULTISPECIES: Ig-like domain-containing protein [Pseudomonas]MCT8950425.1 Ig-like domain-containing protein [Pseudomonas iridis]NVZ46128.1 tandem-95 repeat protein [Pseudomonas tolaasii]NWA51777.1 tandem-95 repeat protein [Pseudomonas tolaasii]
MIETSSLQLSIVKRVLLLIWLFLAGGSVSADILAADKTASITCTKAGVSRPDLGYCSVPMNNSYLTARNVEVTAGSSVELVFGTNTSNNFADIALNYAWQSPRPTVKLQLTDESGVVYAETDVATHSITFGKIYSFTLYLSLPSSLKSGNYTIRMISERTADSFAYVYSIPGIVVRSANNPPTVLNRVLNGLEDTPIQATLNAIDEPGDTHTFRIVKAPAVAHGSATIVGNQLTFTPSSNWNGTTSFTYRANDGRANSNTATVTVTVAPVNDPPSVSNATLALDEDTVGTMTLEVSDVDLEFEGDSHTWSIMTAPNAAHGTASIAGNKLTFTPVKDWNGTTMLTYRATDSKGANSNTATITITVRPVNDAPVASNRTLTVAEDTAGTLTLVATDVDGDALTYSLVTAPNAAHGTVTISSDKATFTPKPNWNGTTTFTYRANDGTTNSNTATVTVTVTPVNDPPSVSNATLALDEDTVGTLTLEVSDVDLEFEGDSHTWNIMTAPNAAHGTASIAGNKLTFTPVKDWNGTTTLTYRATDSKAANSNTATITIIVRPVNDAPVVEPIVRSIPEDTVLEIKLNAIDVDNGPPFVFEIIGTLAEKEGAFSLVGDLLTITPAVDWNGILSLSYRAQDAEGAWSEAQPITVEVTYVNDAPVATGATILAKEGMISDHVEPWVVDVDLPYGDEITFQIVSQPANGSAKLVFGMLEYTPNPQFFGNDAFIIRATDKVGASVEGSVSVVVAKFNYAPTDILPGVVSMFGGIGGTTELKVVDPNTWGSHQLTVIGQPAHGTATIDGNTLTIRTDDSADTTVRIRAVDQDGLTFEKNIVLKFGPAWGMFEGREVKPSGTQVSVPAVATFMTRRDGSYGLQLNDAAVISTLGDEIIAAVTPNSAVGIKLESRDLVPASGMRLTPTKRSANYMEARIAGLNVGVDGVAQVYLSRADMTGPVFSVPVTVWAPEGVLTADTWEILQASGRAQISFSPSNGACSILTSEAVAKTKNALQDRACYVTWTKTPDEWRNASTLANLMMDAGGSSLGNQTVEATAYVFDPSGVKYKVASFTRDLKILPVADQIHFALKPAPQEAYQKVQELSLSLRHTDGPVCDATANEGVAKKTAQQWSSRPSCLIRWMQMPEGMAQQRNTVTPLAEGTMSLLGANNISWKASMFTPSGQEIDIGYGEHSVNVIEPPAIEIDMPASNLVKEGLYSVSQLGGYVGSASVTAIAASLDLAINRADEVIERSTIPSYGRSQRFTRYIEGAEAPLWSVTPYSVDVGYTALPNMRSTKTASLLAVPHDKILPVILNDERTVLDTVSLPIRVAIKDTRYMEDAYRLSSMGDWDIRLLSTTAGVDYEPMTNWEPIDENGEVEFEVDLQSLTNKAVRIIAEARVRSPVPEYELIRESGSPMVLSVLNGEALDGSIQALRVIGPAPLRTSFYAVTNDRYQSGDIGEVRWEMSKDGGVSWEGVEANAKLPQRLSMIFQRGTYLLRAELTNRHSGAKSMTPTVEVIAYVVPVARLKGPANVFIGDSGTFKLTDLKGNTLDTTGMVVEWSEDRGKTWVVGEGSYRLGRNSADRVYLTARLKYSDSPEDKRVYKTLRAGVAFRPVRPPRVQIIGPRRPEVGKEATWVANLMMPYPKMDMTMDGEFILPDGTVVDSTEVKYTPTREDMEKEESHISVRSWINGYEDRGGLGLTQHRLIFWSYDWPEWKINTKYSAKYAPADLTMTARSLGLFREFEGLTIEWDIPPYGGLQMIKDTNQTSRIVRLTEPGIYTFGAHITDSRGNYSYAETEMEFLEPIPWDVKLSWSGDNDANRAPLGVLIRPSITGGHPKDQILSKTFSLNGETLSSSGDYGRATLEKEGVYTVKLDVASAMGHTAAGEVDISVARNKPPVCKLEVVVGRTSWLAKAVCADEDGRMAKNLWFINGEQQALSSNSISVPMWRYPDGEPVITLVGIDNSGAESPPVSNK